MNDPEQIALEDVMYRMMVTADATLDELFHLFAITNDSGEAYYAHREIESIVVEVTSRFQTYCQYSPPSERVVHAFQDVLDTFFDMIEDEYEYDADDFGADVATGYAKDEIDSCTSIVSVCKRTNTLNQDSCVVCLENLTRKARKLGCGHIFHDACVQTWLESKKTCPVCVADIKESSQHLRRSKRLKTK